MGFTKLAGRIKALPLVLAGPIVRRVEPTSVSVWVALRLPRKVKLDVHGPDGAWSGEASTTRFGEFLHLAVVTASRPTDMIPGESYEYELSFERIGNDTGPTGGLFDPNVIAADPASARKLLLYDGQARPSFSPPPDTLDRLRIFHTSCRKIDGGGVDAFPAYDFVLEDYFKHRPLRKRPALMFLTGDNTYIDSADRELLDVATDAGEVLLGKTEFLPGIDKTVVEVPRWRMYDMVNGAGTMSPRPFHSLGLGEILALYLITFSDVLWPPDYDGHKAFKNGLRPTRRIFANIATYMIFDDHEVSNSWYLTRIWVERILSRPLGLRLLQNALTAYTLCQGWGNDPAQFAPDQPGGKLLAAIVRWTGGGFRLDSADEREIRQRLGIPTEEQFIDTAADLSDESLHGPEVVRWYYTVPCKPISLNVLDAYTWGSYDQTDELAPADHLPERALDKQIGPVPPDALLALYVVSSVAIHRRPRMTDPHDLAGDVREQYLALLGVAGVLAVGYVFADGIDHLGWYWVIVGILAGVAIGLAVRGFVKMKAFPDGRIPDMDWLDAAVTSAHLDEVGSEFEWHSPAFERLLAKLARTAARDQPDHRLARVVFLGGDVHASFAMRLAYFAEDDQPKPLRALFASLVSSASKFHGEAASPYDQSGGSFGGWKDKPTAASGGDPEFAWRGGPWIQELTPDATRMTKPPEWRYQLAPVKAIVEPIRIVSPLSPIPTFEEMLDGLNIHKRVTLLELRHSDTVRANNVSEFTFGGTHDAPTVKQESYWWYSGVAEDHAEWFVRGYEVDLTPSPNERPRAPGDPP